MDQISELLWTNDQLIIAQKMVMRKTQNELAPLSQWWWDRIIQTIQALPDEDRTAFVQLSPYLGTDALEFAIRDYVVR